MPVAMQSILRQATRQENEPLNILTFPTHEAYQTGLSDINANFYMWYSEGIKLWNSDFRKIPNNHTMLNYNLGIHQLPAYLDFDLILSQNKFAQFQVAYQLSKKLQIPIISLEHTLPPPNWGSEQLKAHKNMAGDINLFISEYSREAWGWSEKEAHIIHHGIDTDMFKPNDNTQRENHLLSVVNDWVNRDWCCGFNLWKQVVENLPTRVVGDTQGLSKAAGSIEELVGEYQTSRIFLNTSTVSPVPTALLEAMSAGCAIVSTATCMIPEIIQNGVNGYITNSPEQLTIFSKRLLEDKELCEKMGRAARQTILEKFSLDTFKENWTSVLNSASKITNIGGINET